MRTPEEIKKGLELYGNALSYINQLEARVQKWINVNDIEPDYNTVAVVLARNLENWGFSKFIIAAFINGEWIGVPPEWVVTHWMPIPEMPKEE